MVDTKLYIIATPLGNREDITLRALERLKTLEVFFAEDSRELAKLLELYGIPLAGKRIHSYASHNMKEATEKALVVLREGRDIGFVSDRGTPCISDPGALLVARARGEGFTVVPIPGPSSVTTLLSVSGFPSDRFVFLGFPPTTVSARRSLFEHARELELPICFFESARRIRETCAELVGLFPEGNIVFGREMTKLFESFTQFRLAEIDPQSLIEKGEYAVVVLPGEKPATGEAAWDQEIDLRLSSDKDWSKALAQRFGVSAKELYNALQRRKGGRK